MKCIQILNLANQFNKFCSVPFGSVNHRLSLLLRDVLTNQDRDSYLVFLDLLEELAPNFRRQLQEASTLGRILSILSGICPYLLSDLGNTVIFKIPIFNQVIGCVWDSDMLLYHDYEIYHTGKLNQLDCNIKFTNNLPEINGMHITYTTIYDGEVVGAYTSGGSIDFWNHQNNTIRQTLTDICKPLVKECLKDCQNLINLLSVNGIKSDV